MKKRRLLTAVFLLIFLLSSCSPNNVPLAPTQAPATTQTPTPAAAAALPATTTTEPTAAATSTVTTTATAAPSATATFTPTATASPTLTPTSTPGFDQSALLTADKGGVLALPDGAAVVIPPGSLPADTQVSIRREAQPDDQSTPEVAARVSPVYLINLGDQPLQQPATIELPYDPSQLQPEVDEQELFLTYMDEATHEWHYAGGTVDPARHIVSVETTHASPWSINSLNLNAWPVLLDKILSLDAFDLMEGVKAVTTACKPAGKNVQVKSITGPGVINNVLQGCVDAETEDGATLRVLNPKTGYIEVDMDSSRKDIPKKTLLGPGEAVTFNIAFSDHSPLTATYKHSKEAADYMVLEILLNSLPLVPEAAQMSKTPRFLGCMMKELGPIEQAGLYYSQGKTDQATGELEKYWAKQANRQLVLKAADKCGLPGTKTMQKAIDKATLSVSLIKAWGNSLGTLLSKWRHQGDKLEFHWTQSQLTVKITQMANCRYGPGTAYLYAWAVNPGDQVTVLGRNYSATWILVNPPNTKIQCWISTVSAETGVDFKQAPLTSTALPHTTASIPPKNVRAAREGDTVTIAWDQIHTNMRDSQGYLIEATVCRNGGLVSIIQQTNDTSYQVKDEPGCKNPSSGKIYSVDVRGYTDPVKIPWP